MAWVRFKQHLVHIWLIYDLNSPVVSVKDESLGLVSVSRLRVLRLSVLYKILELVLSQSRLVCFNFTQSRLGLVLIWMCSFSNGSDDVGRWQRATFVFFSFSSSRGPLLDWFGQIMLYSHWSTQTWHSTNARVPATDEAVVCTLIEPSNAMQGLTERSRTQIF